MWPWGPAPLDVAEDVLLEWIKLSAAYQRRCVPKQQPMFVCTGPVSDGMHES